MPNNLPHERLNSINSQLGTVKKYLEIGVAKGSTFFQVDAEEKHAVDPRFRFNPTSRSAYTGEHYHSVTSDEYFSRLTHNVQPFDVIFLDGLHTYNQTLRDFLNSLAVAHSKTIWLIDDTIPTDAIAADPDLYKVKTSRELEGDPHNQTWMGDVFKVIVFIDNFFQNYTCMTTEGHGQTVIIPKKQEIQKKSYMTTEEIEKLSYVDSLLMRNNILRPYKFDEILEQISSLSL